MRLYLRTADEKCQVWLDKRRFVWIAGRQLSKGLLNFLQQCLKEQGATWSDIDSLVVFRGPGSFTGLRIGITVANSLAQALDLPIVGSTGLAWRSQGNHQLAVGNNQMLVTPLYASDVRITPPRK